MADRRALKLVGFVYGGVAAAVTVTAFLMVLRDVEAGVAHNFAYGVQDVAQDAAPRAAIASVQ